MKILPVIFFIAFPFALAAQPVLTSGQLPQAGDVVIQDWINTAPNQIPNEGANVTWDLSQNTFNSLEDSGVYVNMTSTVTGWNYNLAFQYLGGAQPRYDFYELSASELRYAGYARADQSLDTLILPGSSLVLPVPISFGNSFAQNLNGYYVNNGNNVMVTGRSFIDADAWGTLILPWATYANVLRVHLRDSLNVLGFPQINDSYYYYSTLERHPLLVIQQKNPPTGYAIRPGGPVGIADQIKKEAIRVFPNPAHGEVYLELPQRTGENLEVTLTDMQGRILYGKYLAGGHSGLLRLDLGEFPAGMYMIRIRLGSGNAMVHRKIVLE